MEKSTKHPHKRRRKLDLDEKCRSLGISYGGWQFYSLAWLPLCCLYWAWPVVYTFLVHDYVTVPEFVKCSIFLVATITALVFLHFADTTAFVINIALWVSVACNTVYVLLATMAYQSELSTTVAANQGGGVLSDFMVGLYAGGAQLAVLIKYVQCTAALIISVALLIIFYLKRKLFVDN